MTVPAHCPQEKPPRLSHEDGGPGTPPPEMVERRSSSGGWLVMTASDPSEPSLTAARREAPASRAHLAATTPPAAAAAAGGGQSQALRQQAEPAAAAAAAPGADDAARRAAARAELSFDIRLSLFSLFCHGATQVATLMAWGSLPASERAQRLLSILYACLPVALPLWAPEWYLRWRRTLLIAYRLGFFQFPLLRKAAGIQKALARPPQPGLRGAAKDMFRVVWGMRLVAVVASAVMNPLSFVPLVPQLLLQVYSVLMVRSNGSLCATTLLSHPTTQGRITIFHHAMHTLTLLLPGGVGHTSSPLLQSMSQQQSCEAFLTFTSALVGVLLPITVLLLTEPPTSLKAWEESDAAVAGGRTRGGALRRLGAWAAGPLSQAVEAGARQLVGHSWLAGRAAAAPEDSALIYANARGSQRRGCWPPLAGWQRVCAWWLLLCMLWAATFELHSASLRRAGAPLMD